MKDFIKQNREYLMQMFQERIDTLKEGVFNMPQGEERDLQIKFIKEYQNYWMVKLKGITRKPNITKFI